MKPECPFSPERVGAIITAYTGIMCGGIRIYHEYVEEILKRPMWGHMLIEPGVSEEIKKAAKPDFLTLSKWCGSAA